MTLRMLLAQLTTWMLRVVREVWFRGNGVREGWNEDRVQAVQGSN